MAAFVCRVSRERADAPWRLTDPGPLEHARELPTLPSLEGLLPEVATVLLGVEARRTTVYAQSPLEGYVLVDDLGQAW